VLCARAGAAVAAGQPESESLVLLDPLRDGGIVVAAKEHGPACYWGVKVRAEVEGLLPERFRGREGTFDLQLSVWYERPEYFWVSEHFACAWMPAIQYSCGWAASPPRSSVPKEIPDAQVAVLQEAVRWFHDPNCPAMLGDPTVGRISDDEVRRRIHEWTVVMDKEVARTTVGLGIFSRHEMDIDLGWHEGWIQMYRKYLADWEAESRIPDDELPLSPGATQGPVVRGVPPRLRYDLRDMPFERQRAVIERHERIWRDWFAAHLDCSVDEFGFKQNDTAGADGPSTLLAVPDDPLEALLL